MVPPPSFVQRLFLASLVADLRRGRMHTRLNGEVVDAGSARRRIALAQRAGWLPTVIVRVPTTGGES
jgi:hypothetical protein